MSAATSSPGAQRKRASELKRVLYPGPLACSILTRFTDGTVGCLFEADDYARIAFVRFPVEWLKETTAR